MAKVPFFSIRHTPPVGRSWTLMVLSFVLPLGLWCAFSYLPFLWHPLMQLELGGAPTFAIGDRIPKAAYADLKADEAEWYANWQQLDEQATEFVPGPKQDPVSAGRRLKRANSRAVFTFGPALQFNGRLTEEDERNADAIVRSLQQWQQEQWSATTFELSSENQERAKLLLAAITFPTDSSEEIVLPDDRVLPSAAAQGFPANPVFLPAPHAVGLNLITAFTTPPLRDGDPWLHERLGHSLWIVIKGFVLAIALGMPLGIIAGSYPSMSRLIEPVIGFVGYIPPPAFAALLVAIFGLQDGPKVGIVFIASVFPMIIMVANTVRSLDVALIEAAQTLGTRPRRVVTRVIIPGAMPRIFDDMRVLLALGWTILIIAEITGEKSGISAYMEQMGRYRRYESVFAAMLIIGTIGLITDQFLAALKPKLFPWVGGTAPRWMMALTRIVGYFPSLAAESAEARDRVVKEHLASVGSSNAVTTPDLAAQEAAK